MTVVNGLDLDTDLNRPTPSKCGRSIHEIVPQCTQDDYKLRRRKINGGGYHYCWQCLICGQRLGASLPAQKIERSLGTPPLFDESLCDEYNQRVQDYYESRRADLDDQILKKRTEWWQRYNEHLRSDKWLNLRRQVLKRCNGICEGCDSSPAAEVHHLTYENMGDELLFQLVGLCVECHRKVHGEAEADAD